MATASTPGPASGPVGGPRLSLSRQILRTLIVPASVGAVAVAIAGGLGHVLIGAFIAVGLALGAVNGVLAQAAASRLTPELAPTRAMIVTGSMRRLGAVTVVALLIAWLAQPNGWTVLVGLVAYQLLSLGAALGAAMREARLDVQQMNGGK